MRVSTCRPCCMAVGCVLTLVAVAALAPPPRAVPPRAMSDDAAPAIATLLTTCREACDEFTPFVHAVYSQLNADPDAAVRKADASFFSLADGVVQALLTRMLADVVGEIVGEEDESALDITSPPFRAGEIVAPAELEAMIIACRDRADALAATLPRTEALRSLVAFIDPIDGTKEFCTGKGEQCSVMVGFAGRETRRSVAGLVYRPLCPERSWASGCAAHGIAEGKLVQRPALPGGSFLASNSGTSPFLDALCAELGATAQPQGGAGNKALRVLEEPDCYYVQDRGVSRWDTCAPEAVLDAHGACLLQLQPLASAPAGAPPPRVPYAYVKGSVNADFVPGVVRLTKYNAKEGALTAEQLAKGAPPVLAASAEELKPYANVLGLFAIREVSDSTGDERFAAAHAAVLRAAAKAPPAYD